MDSQCGEYILDSPIALRNVEIRSSDVIRNDDGAVRKQKKKKKRNSLIKLFYCLKSQGRFSENSCIICSALTFYLSISMLSLLYIITDVATLLFLGEGRPQFAGMQKGSRGDE